MSFCKQEDFMVADKWWSNVTSKLDKSKFQNFRDFIIAIGQVYFGFEYNRKLERDFDRKTYD